MGGALRRVLGILLRPELLLLLVALLVSIGIAELGLRALLASDTAIGERIRHPGLYADYFSDDDYWILQYVFKHRGQPPENPHPLLGWVGDFDRETYRHEKADEAGGRRPVLMYGDSFTECAHPERCFEDLLNGDADFARDHYLVNYGVGGYGLGQIFLLLKNSVDLYDDPFVVVGFMTFDLDRTVLSVRVGQKPRFVAENGQLELTNVPIERHPADWFARHPPSIRSYFASAVEQQIRARFPEWMRDPDVEAHKREVNSLILEAIEEELQSRGLDRIYVVFHADWEGVSTLAKSTDWRDPFVKSFFEERGIPYVWSRGLVGADRAARDATWDDYIGTAHGHPTTRYNELVSAEIKAAVLEGSR